LSIDVIIPNGKLLEPKMHVTKFVNQCGVIVRETIPITVQEWNEPKKSRLGARFVDVRSKKRPLENAHGKFYSTSRVPQIQ
jgi:hypothetical protein